MVDERCRSRNSSSLREKNLNCGPEKFREIGHDIQECQNWCKNSIIAFSGFKYKNPHDNEHIGKIREINFRIYFFCVRSFDENFAI